MRDQRPRTQPVRHFIRHFETLERHILIRKVLGYRFDVRKRINRLKQQVYRAILKGHVNKALSLWFGPCPTPVWAAHAPPVFLRRECPIQIWDDAASGRTEGAAINTAKVPGK